MSEPPQDSERTQVTGIPDGLSAPGYGQHLGERYELEACIEEDVFTFTYDAYDVAASERVLVRVVRPELLDGPHESEAVAKRLREVIGVGGAFLTPLLDAGCEGPWVYTVESIAQGASLRSVLDSRLARGETLLAKELLPVISRIEAGLRAIPPPWSHGDLRPERIFFTSDGLKLNGGFITPALPPRALKKALKNDEPLTRRYSVDLSRGSGGDDADRYRVGCLAHECLLGRPPGGPDTPLPTRLGEVGHEVARLLAKDPHKRSPSLRPLIRVLADACSVPAPTVDPKAYRRARRSSIPKLSRPTESDDEPTRLAPRPRRIPGAASGGTQEVTLDQVIEELESADGLPLVELTEADDPSEKRSPSTQELSLDQVIEESVATRLRLPEPSAAQLSDHDEMRNRATQRARESGLDPRLVRAAFANVDRAKDDYLVDSTPSSEEGFEVPSPASETSLSDTLEDTAKSPVISPPAEDITAPQPSAPSNDSARRTPPEPEPEPDPPRPQAPRPPSLDVSAAASPITTEKRESRPIHTMRPKVRQKASTSGDAMRLILIALLGGLLLLGLALWYRDYVSAPMQMEPTIEAED